MSKLDRQLDGLTGDGRVEIEISEGQDVDVGELHQLLRNEIDRRHHRIPIDLRRVHGAPVELIDVLISAEKYARKQGKILTISYALPPMQEALDPMRRRATKSAQKGDEDAGAAAKSLLDEQNASEHRYDITRAEKIGRKRTRRNTGKQYAIKRYIVLGSIIAVATLAIGWIEYVILFNESPSTVVPSKILERR